MTCALTLRREVLLPADYAVLSWFTRPWYRRAIGRLLGRRPW